MVISKIYVEGGDRIGKLQSCLQEALRTLIERAGIDTSEMRIVFCGDRTHAFEDFKTALSDRLIGKDGAHALLLVDSEFPIVEKAYQFG